MKSKLNKAKKKGLSLTFTQGTNLGTKMDSQLRGSACPRPVRTLRSRFMSASILEMVILCMMASVTLCSRSCHFMRADLEVNARPVNPFL